MDRLLSTIETRRASCPEHGEYVSRNLLRNIWTKCPACLEIEERAKEVEAEKQAREAADRRHAKRLRSSRIPTRFIGRGFDDFKTNSDAQRRALSIARDYAEQFSEKAGRGQGLILSGLPGTGKSHLAGAILQTMLERDVCYVTCMDMIREVRDTWRKDSARSELDVLNAFGELDLLVIDEVGVQYGTEGEQTIIFDVLDRRYRDVRPTVILTNQDMAGLKTFIGERIFDRLTETCKWVPFDWPSYRVQAGRESRAHGLPRDTTPVDSATEGST